MLGFVRDVNIGLCSGLERRVGLRACIRLVLWEVWTGEDGSVQKS